MGSETSKSLQKIRKGTMTRFSSNQTDRSRSSPAVSENSSTPDDIKLVTSIDEDNGEKHYHGIEDHGYFLPNDIAAQDQFEIQHYILRHAFKGYLKFKNYYHVYDMTVISSISDVISTEVKKLLKTPDIKVVDVGCGKGWWLDSVMKVYPAPQYFGIDIDEEILRAAANYLPGSVSLTAGNSLKRLPFADSTFDFTHQRMMVTDYSKNNFPIAIKELFRITKNEGLIELVEER
ncbi:hypothetical protein HK100_000835 [Physocladia obscura]|uniref:Methyltransferase domain-containing protein n=1 Tax=Physocladia obscura TaxID=109957 RepID=A0AAD5SZH8_9FUNG|nr:hypothetical protein HK100_000835 [Physocladia obscura]